MAEPPSLAQAPAAGPSLAAMRPAHLERHPRVGDWLGFVDGRVLVKTGKVELGQGIHCALATIAADELRVAASQIDVAPVSTRTSPDEDYTAGSLSITQSGAAIRAACATARTRLLEMASRQTGRALDSLSIENGVVRVDGRTFGYWDDLFASVLDERIDAVVAYRSPDGPRYGDGLRQDLRALFTGRRGYVHDLTMPGLLFGRVVRPPPPARMLLGVDERRSRAVSGVVTVVRDGRFLGVVADREDAAVRAAELLRADARWSDETVPSFDACGEWLEAYAGPSELVSETGAPGDGPWTLSATYSKPLIAHGSIGPSAAVAVWTSDGNLEVWSHTQGVYPLKRELARILALSPERVHVTHVEGAGCYGHNGAEDAALDAALLARAVPGSPVKLTWSRADESGHEPYGSAMRMRLSATLGADGRVEDWRHEFWSNGHVGRPGFSEQPVLLAAAEMDPPFRLATASDPPMPPGGSQRNSVPLYAFSSTRIVSWPVRYAPLRTSSLRALGAFANVFAIESFLDELAGVAGVDPLEFRLRHLPDTRARAVLETAAERAGWSTPAVDGRGRGLAFARYKNSAAYCAVVAEVDDDAPLGVSRLVVCVDAGRIVAPDGVENQIEGGAVQAASWTLKEAVRLHDGTAPLDWAAYPIMRFTEVPTVEVILLDRPAEPSLGVGECVAGPVAAAIANAFAAAYGVRVRDLPINRERVLAALQD